MAAIFWLDDEADRLTFDTTREVLESAGMQVTSSTSVTEAARLLLEQRSHFDLVLLDVLMPPQGRYSKDESENGTATGLRFLEELKRQRPDLPVILVTVTQQAEDLDRFLSEQHVDGYVKKPFLPHDLLEEIQAILGRAD